MTTFDACFRVVVGVEGNYSDNPADPGNWTGGRCGAGVCKGTRFGISAGAYPSLDIKNLKLEQAQSIYQRDYWAPICGEKLPAPLALLVFDAAVNNGVTRAAKWLQAVVGVAQDGVVGPLTLAAVSSKAGEGAAVLAEFQAQRLVFMAGLPTWRTFSGGWSRRLCRLPFDAVQMGGCS